MCDLLFAALLQAQVNFVYRVCHLSRNLYGIDLICTVRPLLGVRICCHQGQTGSHIFALVVQKMPSARDRFCLRWCDTLATMMTDSALATWVDFGMPEIFVSYAHVCAVCTCHHGRCLKFALLLKLHIKPLRGDFITLHGNFRGT